MEKLFAWMTPVFMIVLGVVIIGIYVGYITPDKPAIFVIGVLAVAGGITRLIGLAYEYKDKAGGPYSTADGKSEW